MAEQAAKKPKTDATAGDTSAAMAFLRGGHDYTLPGEDQPPIEGDLKVRNPSHIKPSQLMLGGAPLACMYKDVTPEGAKACIDRALELGIRYIDTAPWYGAGLSECRIAEALQDHKDITVSTKCGRIIKPKADIDPKVDQYEEAYESNFFTDKYHMNRVCALYTGDGVRESFRQSCERLKVDKIECLRLHDAETPDRFAAATAPGGAVEAMIALKAEGKVKELSLGMNSHRHILAILRMYKNTFDNIMLSNAFTLIDHDCREMLMECQTQDVKIHNVGIFCSGLLWGGDNYMYGKGIPDTVKEKVTKWTALAKKHDLTLPQVALSFAFLPEIVDMAAFGTSRASNVDENVGLCGKAIPLALWEEAKASGLISDFVPLPKE